MDAWADSMNEGALYLNSDVPSRPLLILFPELDDRPNSAEESHDRVQTLSKDVCPTISVSSRLGDWLFLFGHCSHACLTISSEMGELLEISQALAMRSLEI